MSSMLCTEDISRKSSLDIIISERFIWFRHKGDIRVMKDSLCYSVGALLYSPANKSAIADSVIHERFSKPYSLALCLEDTINDNYVEEAEEILIHSLTRIYKEKKKQAFFVPNIFIRVRRPGQIPNLYARLKEAGDLLTGFIIPKFSPRNADDYIAEIEKLNQRADRTVYMMPIFESPDIIDLRTRYSILYQLKDKLDAIDKHVLNIRVGGSDLCHMFGFRRHSDETIYDIRPVADIFSDIITVFGMDYIISGPVWEYYDGENWENGLKQELKRDKLSGFVGKTAIHPRQLPAINAAFKVSREDYKDAVSILSWDTDNHSFVSGNSSCKRMDEFKTHRNWAREIQMRAEAFGIEA